MSFGFLGIQFGFALQNANVSRIFETLGASIDQIPILWLAAPVTGLLVQPVIGYWSDRTWGRLGRRRPFFLAGAIFASIALIVMPMSPILWVAAGILGFIMSTFFGNQAIYALLVGGVSLLIAALCTLFVDDVDEPVADDAEPDPAQVGAWSPTQ